MQEEINFNGELVTLVDGMPVFSPMAKLIDSFKVIIARDRGGVIKGDHDGRKKLLATKELAYIWFMTDRKSPIKNNFDENMRHAKTLEKISMPEGWVPDKHIQIAMSDWEDITETQSSKVLENMKASLFSSDRIITLLRKKIDNRIGSIEMLDDVDVMINDAGVSELDVLMKDLKTLIDLSNKIPDIISTIEKLEDKVSKEKSDGKGKGGKSINRFQFPKNKR